jgi:hypothetical protein
VKAMETALASGRALTGNPVCRKKAASTSEGFLFYLSGAAVAPPLISAARVWR